MKPQKTKGDLVLATEAVFDDDSLRAKVTIIRPGMSKNRKNWTAEVLKKASESGFWNGSRMFIDHAQKTGTSSVPSKRRRGMRDMVSAIEKTEIAEDGRVVADVIFFDEDFYKWARRAKDHIGTSVDLLFAGKEVRERGQQPYYAVEELVTNNSVDWVLDPAAGGQIESFVTAQEGEDDVEWNEVTADMLRQHRPDLVQALEGSGATPPPSGGSTPLTAEAVAEIVKTNLKEAREQWDQEHEAQEAVRKQYSAAIQATKLPTRTQNRLIAAFESESSFDQAKVDAAIKEAQEEFQEAGVRPQIRGGGPSNTGETSTQPLREVSPIHAAMEQAFKVPVASGKKSTEGGND